MYEYRRSTLKYEAAQTEAIVAKLEMVVAVLHGTTILVHCVFFGAIGVIPGLILGASTYRGGEIYPIVTGLVGLMFGYWLGSNAFTVFGVTLEWMAQLLIAQGELLSVLRQQQEREILEKQERVQSVPTLTRATGSVPRNEAPQPQEFSPEVKAALESQSAAGDYVSILGCGVDVWNQWRQEHSEIHPDLSGVDLSGRTFNQADFSNMDLHDSNFERTFLMEANFKEANLSQANLKKAKLRWADFQGADLSQADFSGAVMDGANLERANLRQANLETAYLAGADLSGADVSATKFSSAELRGATMPDGTLHS